MITMEQRAPSKKLYLLKVQLTLTEIVIAYQPFLSKIYKDMLKTY